MNMVTTMGLRRMAAALMFTQLALFSPAALGVNAPDAGMPYARCLSQGKDCLKKGDFSKAVKSFESAVKESPQSCEANFLLGESYCKVKNFGKAKQAYRAAIRVGRGSDHAQKANVALMKLPRNLVAPRSGPRTRMLISMLGIARERSATGEAKPTVIDFYASWCQPCRQLETVMEKVKSQYGDKVSFMRVDVDDPNNERLIDQYEVSPIPTVIFLNPEGEVVTFTIGFSGESGVTEALEKILTRQG